MRHINAYNAESSNKVTKAPTISPAIIVSDIDALNESLYKEITPNIVVPAASRTIPFLSIIPIMLIAPNRAMNPKGSPEMSKPMYHYRKVFFGYKTTRGRMFM